MNEKPASIADYIRQHPEALQAKLEEMRRIIAAAAPDAQETISYAMPAFRRNSVLVYFAAFKKHIGFYPTASGVREFADDLTGYKTSKGAIQFPLDGKLPAKLITKMVKFRVAEDLQKAAAKGRPRA